MKKILTGSLIAMALMAFTGCNDTTAETATSAKTEKCGEGKCGGDKKAAEANATKCGGDKKATEANSTKCGGDKK